MPLYKAQNTDFRINTMKNSIHGDHTMAQLNSPGVSVTVIDESFYTSAAPGTVPLIVVASAENKPNASNTGTAPGTLKVNSGQVYLLTSQKDLVDTFGTPIFQTDANNNAIHAGEMNEYGLQAAYSYLGVSNRAYIVRADLDLGQLVASADAPAGPPANGSYWFDTTDTHYGIFEWNSASAILGGQAFINKIPLVITDSTQVADFEGSDFTPLSSIGAIGDYALVAVTTLNTLWFKKGETNTSAGSWVEVGSASWIASRPAAQGNKANLTVTDIVLADTFVITVNGQANTVTSVTNLTALKDGINGLAISGITAAIVNDYLEIYSTGNDFTLSGASVTKAGLVATTYKAPALQVSPHYQVPTFKTIDNAGTANGRPTGSVWIKTTTPNLGANWVVKRYSDVTGLWEEKLAPLYSGNHAALSALDPTGGGINLPLGTVYVKYNDSEELSPLANFKIYARRGVGATAIKSALITAGTFTAGTNTFTISWTSKSSDAYSTPVSVSFTATGGVSDITAFLTALTSKLVNTPITATKAPTTNQIIISHVQGGDIKFVDGANTPIFNVFASSTNLYADPTGNANSWVASLWTAEVGGVSFVKASPDALVTEPEDGVLWYNSMIEEVDIMIHNGTDWVAYRNYDQSAGGPETDINGPIVSATKPLLQSNGGELANGDLWIDTSDLENYPRIHKFNYALKKWDLVDNTDQTTENGVLFADARWNTNGISSEPGIITDMLGGTGDSEVDAAANFLDPDAPNPHLYPRGMLLWNLRRSGFNVKRFVRNYIDTLERNTRVNNELMTDYYPHRWISWAANNEDGSGKFGRHAQRGVVIQALQAVVNSNQDIRDDESRIFNLLACPGYPELISELISLNVDRGLTAFIVGDSPARLTPDATSLNNWGNNIAGVLQDNDKGLVSYDEYMGVYYPWGYSSDNLGNNIAVPPSHMMLRTIALSDNVSYPWFAPAGTRRGGITNASAVGYVDSEGEFRSVSLNTGQRDTLQQSCKVNPITFITGAGIVCFGQRTRARNASALDRVNVARLVIYLRRQFSQLAKPYIFEPNDKITRDEIKNAAESLLLELVGQRALYDYLVVCDASNNTPARIDRNELYLDVAIEPVKAVEFIYIPLRLKNTGTIKNISSQ